MTQQRFLIKSFACILANVAETCLFVNCQAAGDEVQIPVVIDSFSGRSQRLKLRKRLGFETADVLDEVDESGAALFTAQVTMS